MLTALIREVSPHITGCELSFQQRQPIDVELARRQHAAYLEALQSLGVDVHLLPAIDEAPDCVFVEDPVIVLDEVAVVTRMGALSRRSESASLAETVGQYRQLLRIEAPATLEGGDVLHIPGKTLYVGLSRRTNVAGIQQLAQMLIPYGYWVVPIEVRGCLHLKSAICFLGEMGGEKWVLANRAWIDTDGLCGLRILDVDPSEPHAANVLRLGDSVVMPSSYPRTQGKIEALGFQVLTVDTSELIKAEAGVTCMSLIFNR